MLRRIERWLHQHVFKVGWLSTHNYQTTTILYYTFFLPGVVLHEVVYYLAAGVFNVRVEREIKWPSEQEIGELKLNFVKLAPRTSPLRKAIISSSPLLVGLICIWLIASEIFDITAVVERMSSGELVDIGAAFNMLIGAPLFWLWVYIIFTIANTMFPTAPKDLRGWRSVLIGLGVVGVAMFIVGIGSEVFQVLQAPLGNIILVLTQTFVLIICIDVIMVLALGLIEYTIERVTGHSATFRGNRMYTMTREEAIAEREKARERERKRQERAQRAREADTGILSIYHFAFSIPGAPNEETVTELEPLPEPPISTEEEIPPSLPERPQSMPVFGGLAEEQKEREIVTEDDRIQRDKIASRIHAPDNSVAVLEDNALQSDEESEHGEVVSEPPPAITDTVVSPEQETEAIGAVSEEVTTSTPQEDDEGESESDADLERRSRGEDDVSSLFEQLNTDDVDSISVDQTLSIPSERRRFGSRFGTLADTDQTDDRLKRFGQARTTSSSPAAQNDEDNTEETTYSRFKRPTGLGARFQPSAPSPLQPNDPQAVSEDEEDETLEDELVYEDIEDAALYYDDDEPYYDYDEDYVDDDVD